MSNPSDFTPSPSSDVLEIKLYAHVVPGAEGTFIVSAKPGRRGAVVSGMAVRPIRVLDEGATTAEQIAEALLREYGEADADAAMRDGLGDDDADTDPDDETEEIGSAL